jgi:hypothetical protein
MPEYATITTSVTGHGSDEAVVVVLQATPAVPNHLLEYAAEPARISVGKVQASAGDDGVIRLRIPIGTEPAAPFWRFEMRIESGYGKTRSLDLGSLQVTESTTLAALMFPDMVGVEPTPAVTFFENGDGTVTFSGPGVTDNGDGTATLSNPNAVDNGDGTFTFAA